MRLAMTSGGISASYAATPREVYVRNNTDLAGLQAIHDGLVSIGGGYIVFEAGSYVATTTANIDAAFVGIKFNNARIDISGIGSGNFFLTYYQSVAFNSASIINHLSTEDGYIFGGFAVNAGGSSGVGALRFNSTVSSATIRHQFNRMRLITSYKALSFLNRAPFVKFYNCHFKNNGIGLYQETSPTDFTESNAFTDCIFDGNDVHLQLDGGGIFTLHNTSLDYHYSRVADIKQGGKVIMTGGTSHIEFDYGANGGETNSPVRFTNANSAFIMRDGCIAYTGSGQNPAWTSFFEMSNSSQLVDVTLARAIKLGRLTDTAGFDCFAVANTNSITPIVRLNIPPQGIDPNDIPTMTQYVDVTAGFGIGGMLRNGVDDPYNELAHRIGLTGTAAIASVNATDNGVTQKNGQKMLKITGAGKVVISMPVMDRSRRHAWEFFTATSTSTSVFSGSVTIKELQTGFAHKFDETTVTMVPDTRGMVYSGTTVTINSASATWVRRSWKDCNTSVWPSPRQNIGNIILIEINTASMSAGALYLSHFAFDLI